MANKLRSDGGRLVEWLRPELMEEVRRVFEPRCEKKLLDGELVEVVENLAEVLETICRFEWRTKYGTR